MAVTMQTDQHKELPVPDAGLDSASDSAATPAPTTPPMRRQLLNVALIVGAILAAGAVTGRFSVVAVLISLLLMIMLHEFGHFITAKWCGMKVTEFFVGFGPKLFSVRRGETEYGVKALPLGGYVRIVGMNNLETVAPEDEARTFRQQSFPKRLLVMAAGSATHVILAFVLLLVYFGPVGRVQAADHVASVVGSVEAGSPAEKAGLRPGDHIVGAGNRQVDDFRQLRDLFTASQGDEVTQQNVKPVRVRVERNGATFDKFIVPMIVDCVPIIGIRAQDSGTSIEHLGIGASVGESWKFMREALPQPASALGSFFAPDNLRRYSKQVTNATSADACSGANQQRFLSVVGLANVAGQAADNGIRSILFLLININLFVAVVNMLPLLPLDGGHILIAIYERIRERKGRRYFADVSKMLPVAVAVIAIMAVIGLSSLYLDVVRPAPNPFR